jgi:clan AA aspartic protease
MMQGCVNDSGEPVVRIAVYGKFGASVDVDAIIDTGFSEYLTLPFSIIQGLNLDQLDTVRIRLADGSHASCDIYRGRVGWLDAAITVDIQSAETDPLVGLKLLQGCNLSVDFTENGIVSIERLG